jgi:hypothetical protein
VVEALLAAGADKDAKKEGGCTALYAATENGHLAVAEALRAAGAEAGARPQTPLLELGDGCSSSHCSSGSEQEGSGAYDADIRSGGDSEEGEEEVATHSFAAARTALLDRRGFLHCDVVQHGAGSAKTRRLAGGGQWAVTHHHPPAPRGQPIDIAESEGEGEGESQAWCASGCGSRRCTCQEPPSGGRAAGGVPHGTPMVGRHVAEEGVLGQPMEVPRPSVPGGFVSFVTDFPVISNGLIGKSLLYKWNLEPPCWGWFLGRVARAYTGSRVDLNYVIQFDIGFISGTNPSFLTEEGYGSGESDKHFWVLLEK